MIVIRSESADDRAAIARVTREAFAQHGHSAQSEASIIGGLRDAGALSLSLVAEVDGRIVGHVAFSPVRVMRADGAEIDRWHGLGPLSVLPSLQGQGIGSRLVREGLARLEAMAARGCVVLGEPAYYHRFGFASDPGLVAEGLPPECFMFRAAAGEVVAGTVTYHPAFFTVG